jgi:leucyl-tRNA synthetase
MTGINFKEIESKWQKKWEEAKLFEVSEDSKKPKFYVLEMFPYPSGDGLHMGHALNYTIGDVYARFKTLKGFNVLHPMGYDALGLPAENAAIKAGTHPQDYTNESIKNYVRQQKELGITYDWPRVVNTASPDFYKWDQWIFLKMFERGLAYQKTAAVNWCGKCQSVLANEQVHNGKCWRHEDTDVEIKHLNQWFLKITEYADELYEEIDKLDGWPSKTKAMQKNWIGKSHGTEIDFEVGAGGEISNVVIVHGSPNRDKSKDKDYVSDNEKGWIGWIKKELDKKGMICNCPQMPTPWEPKYEEWKREFEKISIDENSVLVGHSAGGGFLVRWIGEEKKKIKKLILVSPGKVSKSDRLEEFYGNKFHKEVKNLVKEKIIVYTSEDDIDYHIEAAEEYSKEFEGKLIKFSKGYGHFTSKTLVSNKFPELLEEIMSSKTWPIFTTRPDTIFGVTFMVVSAQHPKLMELVTKEQKKEVDKFLKKIKTVSQKSIKEVEELNKEGVFTGSYAVNPATNEKIPIWAGNFVVADYGSGMVMAVPAHDQRDFEFAKKYGINVKQVICQKDPLDFKNRYTGKKAFTEQGILMNSKQFNALSNEYAKEKITFWLSEKGKARKVVNFRLRDWLVSRQRYWGTPIPIIHCDVCGAVPVPEKDLPVELPRDVKFGKGNPLETNKKWIEVKCPKCGEIGRRETDTMDTFVNSSWYFLRYCDPKNDKKIFDSKKANYWCPVDQYIGGAEHACMHLIYFRFYTKFLADLGLINFREPAKRLFHQGMLLGEGGIKMSKSKGNVITPDAVSEKYGIDTARYFMLSLASPDKPRDWSEKGIAGSMRFISKIFNIFEKIKIGKDSDELEKLINKTIKETEEQYENFDLRTATIRLKELFEKLSDEKEASKKTLENSLILLSPFCPHIAEELWEKLGNEPFISLQKWPGYKKITTESKENNVNDNAIREIKYFLEKIEKRPEKIFVYVMPFEIKDANREKISKEIGVNVRIFAVNDKNKHDPENKSKKAKPGKPAVYWE